MQRVSSNYEAPFRLVDKCSNNIWNISGKACKFDSYWKIKGSCNIHNVISRPKCRVKSNRVKRPEKILKRTSCLVLLIPVKLIYRGTMKIIRNITELKKGDTVIVKDYACFEALGFRSVSGNVFNIVQGMPNFTIKCNETGSIESVSVESGKIFLIG